VLLVTASDNGNQMYLTAKAMRQYLGYDAKQVCTDLSWLGYEYDWCLNEYIGNVDSGEVADFAKGCDFFIFGDYMFNLPGVSFKSLVHSENSCVVAIGTIMRDNIHRVFAQQLKHRLMVLSPLQKQSIYTGLITIPFSTTIIDVGRIDELSRGIKKNDRLTFCHAPTSNPEIKGTSVFQAMADQFSADIEFDLLNRVPWETAITRKASAHVMLYSGNAGGDSTFGLNTLEAMCTGQHVISATSPWSYMVYPDLPVESIHPAITGKTTEDGLEDSVKRLIHEFSQKNAGDAFPSEELAAYSRQWVINHASPEIIADRWDLFFKWVADKTIRPGSM